VSDLVGINIWPNYCSAGSNNIGTSNNVPFRIYDSANWTAVAGTDCKTANLYSKPAINITSYLQGKNPRTNLIIEFKDTFATVHTNTVNNVYLDLIILPKIACGNNEIEAGE